MGYNGVNMLRIACPGRAVPSAGKCSHAFSPSKPEHPMAVSLFAAEFFEDGFLTAPLAVNNWEPGTHLELYGPLGRGFQLPSHVQRLALAGIGEPGYRLLPIILQALKKDAAVVLFIEGESPSLPTAVEVHPLDLLPDAYGWADFLAIEASIGAIASLRNRLGIMSNAVNLLCPAQVLVVSPMPCGGVADCGVCCVKTQRSWKMVCKHGPVFALELLI